MGFEPRAVNALVGVERPGAETTAATDFEVDPDRNLPVGSGSVDLAVPHFGRCVGLVFREQGVDFADFGHLKLWFRIHDWVLSLSA